MFARWRDPSRAGLHGVGTGALQAHVWSILRLGSVVVRNVLFISEDEGESVDAFQLFR